MTQWLFYGNINDHQSSVMGKSPIKFGLDCCGQAWATELGFTWIVGRGGPRGVALDSHETCSDLSHAEFSVPHSTRQISPAKSPACGHLRLRKTPCTLKKNCCMDHPSQSGQKLKNCNPLWIMMGRSQMFIGHFDWQSFEKHAKNQHQVILGVVVSTSLR